MARQRMTRPEVFLDEFLNELPPLVRWSYLALKACADREGRLEDRPGRLRVQCIPHDPVTAGEFDAILWQLAEHPRPAPFLTRYTVDGQNFIQINGWDQRPHINEADSVIPPVSCGVTRTLAGAPTKHLPSTVQALTKHPTCPPDTDTESDTKTESESKKAAPSNSAGEGAGEGYDAPAGADAPEPPARAGAVVSMEKGRKPRPKPVPVSLDTPVNREPIDTYNQIFGTSIGYTPGNLRAAERARNEGYALDQMRQVFTAVKARDTPTAAWCDEHNREFEYLIRPMYRDRKTQELVQGPLDKIPNELATGRRVG